MDIKPTADASGVGVFVFVFLWEHWGACSEKAHYLIKGELSHTKDLLNQILKSLLYILKKLFSKKCFKSVSHALPIRLKYSIKFQAKQQQNIRIGFHFAFLKILINECTLLWCQWARVFKVVLIRLCKLYANYRHNFKLDIVQASQILKLKLTAEWISWNYITSLIIHFFLFKKVSQFIASCKTLTFLPTYTMIIPCKHELKTTLSSIQSKSKENGS